MRYAWALLAAALAMGAGPMPKPSKLLWSRADHDAVIEAKTLYKAGAYAQSLALYNQVLEHHPRDIDSLRYRGACYLHLDQPERALADFDAIIAHDILRRSTLVLTPLTAFYGPIDAGWPAGYTNRGIALLQLGRDLEAVEAFQLAIQAHTMWSMRIPKREWASPYVGLGEAFFQLGRYDLSRQAYEMVQKFDPGNPLGAEGRSRALVAMGKPKAALPEANAAVEGNPGAPRAWRNRGADLAAMGRNEEALKDFNEALRRDPTNALTWKSRGGLLVRLGRPEEALRDLNEAIRLNPKLASAYQNRGAAYNCLKQYEKAAKDLEAAVKLEPKNVGAHNNLGLALAALGRTDQAVLEFSQAIRLGGLNAAIFLNRALAYERLGVLDAAAGDFAEAMKHDSQSTLAKEGLARVQRAGMEPTPASAGEDMALPVHSGTYEEAVARGLKNLGDGDRMAAIRGFSDAIRRKPGQPDAHALRGFVRLMAGENGGGDDARAYLRLVRWTSPSAAEVAIVGALADRREGRMGEAQRLLDEALANTRADAWPYPALLYLRGQLDAEGLRARAKSDRQRAEALAVIGLSLGLVGDRQGAVEPLKAAAAYRETEVGSMLVEVANAALEQVE